MNDRRIKKNKISPKIISSSSKPQNNEEITTANTKSSTLFSNSSWTQPTLFACLIYIYTTLLFCVTVNIPKLFDQNYHTSLSSRISDLNSTWEEYSSIIEPLPYFTLKFNYYLHKLHPSGYLFFNTCLHGANSVLIFFLALYLLPGCLLFASIWAFIFATHPIHTDAVSSLSGRSELMSFFFALCSIFSYLSSIGCCFILKTWKRRFFLLFSFLLLFLAMLCKESVGISLFFAIVIIDLWWMYSSRHLLNAPDIFKTLSTLPISIEYQLLHKNDDNTPFLTHTWHNLVNKQKYSMLLRWLMLLGFISIYFWGKELFIGKIFNYISSQTSQHYIINSSLSIRIYSFLYVSGYYLYLLFFPWFLSCDYSYDCLHQVESLLDYHHILSLLFLSLFYLFFRVSRLYLFPNFNNSISTYQSFINNSNNSEHQNQSNQIFSSPLTSITHPLFSHFSVNSNVDELNTHHLVGLLFLALGWIIFFFPYNLLSLYPDTFLVEISEKFLYFPSLGFCLILTLAFYTSFGKLYHILFPSISFSFSSFFFEFPHFLNFRAKHGDIFSKFITLCISNIQRFFLFFYKIPPQFFRFSFLLILLSLFSASTFNRNQDWINPLLLWKKSHFVCPNSLRVLDSLSLALDEAGNYQEALQIRQESERAHQEVKNIIRYDQWYHNILSNWHFTYLLGTKSFPTYNVTLAESYAQKCIYYASERHHSYSFNLCHTLLRDIYLDSGPQSIEKAKKLIKECLNSDLDLTFKKRCYVQKGIYHYLKKNYKKALLAWQKVVSIWSDEYTTWFNIGAIHYNNKNWPKALEAFEIVNSLYPSYNNVQSLLKKCRENLELSSKN